MTIHSLDHSCCVDNGIRSHCKGCLGAHIKLLCHVRVFCGADMLHVPVLACKRFSTCVYTLHEGPIELILTLATNRSPNTKKGTKLVKACCISMRDLYYGTS
jgi:hypothetical protein